MTEKGKIIFENKSESFLPDEPEFLEDIGWAGGGKSQQVFVQMRNRIKELETENNLYKTALNFAAAGTLYLLDDIVWESSPVSEDFRREFLELIGKLR